MAQARDEQGVAPAPAPAPAGWLPQDIPPAGLLLTLGSLLLWIYFLTLIPAIAAGEIVQATIPWAPSLEVELAFFVDGLGLLFALLITGIGALIFLYAGGYLAGHRQLGRFFALLTLFMGSMLGLVLASNLLALFIFWELTSITSYLLIGFDSERAEARKAALQALLVTGGGGLALMAGVILLGQAGGTFSIPVLLQKPDVIRESPHYLAILGLVSLGAFTKSAQFPFHFWLPGAMEAPTPVSAYLHSATMVKAGVYLLARLSPVLGGSEPWVYGITGVGAATMLAGGCLALRQTDMKRILAYSTVSALGTLTLLLGLGATYAVNAAMVFLFSHALYKGALFLVVGAVDHETGTRDVTRLGGLRRAMPITTLAAVLAALSLAGLGPVLSFIGKEMLLEAVWEAPATRNVLTGSSVLASALFFAVAAIIAIRPFFGSPRDTPRQPHEPPATLWIGPLLLALLGLVGGLFPAGVGQAVISPAATAILGRPTLVKWSLWHGFNTALALSAASAVVGLVLFLNWSAIRNTMARLEPLLAWGPAQLYERGFAGLIGLAGLITRILQNGYLRYYVMTVVGVSFLLTAHTLLRGQVLLRSEGWNDLFPHEFLLAALTIAAALMSVLSRSRLGAIAALGVVGYAVALLFLMFGAPDLAMTQVLVETLTVVLLVYVLHYLPPFVRRTSPLTRLRDAVIATSAGVVMTGLVLMALTMQPHPSLAGFFAAQSVPAAHGRNIVNVILVDFRALDTLGEILVLAVAATGVYALLRLRREIREDVTECSR